MRCFGRLGWRVNFQIAPNDIIDLPSRSIKQDSSRTIEQFYRLSVLSVAIRGNSIGNTPTACTVPKESYVGTSVTDSGNAESFVTDLSNEEINVTS